MSDIEIKAEQTLQATGTYRVPVAVDVIAHRLKLTIEAADLGEDVSGMLVIEKGHGAIAYNSSHAPVRQRFTIAHEIGHYILHAKKRVASQLFIDRGLMSKDRRITFLRNANSATGSEKDERDANQFGAALLMPKQLVSQEIKKHDLDLDDEDDICMLSKRFNVSTAAMTNRLINLQLLH